MDIQKHVADAIQSINDATTAEFGKQVKTHVQNIATYQKQIVQLQASIEQTKKALRELKLETMDTFTVTE